MDLHNLLVFQDLFNDDVFRDIEKTISRENLNKGAVAAKLINKAEQLGLSGNIIRSYMIYTVAHQSNCVSYAVEKSGGKIGKSLYQAFCHDIELIEKLLLLKPSLLLDCDLLDDYEPTNINQSKHRLAKIRQMFLSIIIEYLAVEIWQIIELSVGIEMRIV